MKVIVSIFYLFVFYLFLLGLTRAVVQGGVAYGRPAVIPFYTTVDFLGSNLAGAKGIAGLGLHMSWSADSRTFVMASAANSARLAQERKVRARRVITAIGIAFFVTLIASYISCLIVAYRFGALNTTGWHYRWMPQFYGKVMHEQIMYPHGPDFSKIIFDAAGALLMVLFIFMQNRFLWWPLHPLGLAIGSTSPAQWVWFSIFLGWLIKAFIMRYLGVKVYKKVIPLFLGLIAGGFVAAGFWIGIDSITGMTGNVFTIR
jgi:hypothetical protein